MEELNHTKRVLLCHLAERICDISSSPLFERRIDDEHAKFEDSCEAASKED